MKCNTKCCHYNEDKTCILSDKEVRDNIKMDDTYSPICGLFKFRESKPMTKEELKESRNAIIIGLIITALFFLFCHLIFGVLNWRPF